MMAVPFKGSGLEHTDFKKLLALMEEIKAEEGLPLTDASTRVWEELSRLRYEVAGACKISSEDEIADIIESRSEEDIANINALLEKIDTVYNQRPSPMQEHLPINHVRTHASGTSVTAAVIEDQYNSSPTQEVDSRGTVIVTVTEFLFDKSLLTHTSNLQASLRRHPIIQAASLQTFIVSRSLSFRARSGPGVESYFHTLHPSYLICSRTWEAQTRHRQVFHLSIILHLTCVTIVNTIVSRFTFHRGEILQLIGRPRCCHYGRLQEFFLPLRAHGSVLLPATWSIRAPLYLHQEKRDS